MMIVSNQQGRLELIDWTLWNARVKPSQDSSPLEAP
jgi:hypothetical protein